MLMCVSVASATVWEGSVSSDFFDPNNWNPVTLPDATAEVGVIDTPVVGGFEPVIAAPDVIDAYRLLIGETTAGVLNMTGGGINLTDQNNSYLQVGIGADGTFNMSGGTFTIPQSGQRDQIEVGLGAVTGTMNITGGTIVTDEQPGGSKVGFFRVGEADNSVGIVNITDATVTWTTDRQNGLHLGFGINSQGTLNLFPGGVFDAANGRALIGIGDGAIGTIHVQGGTFDHSTGAWMQLGDETNATGNIIVDSGEFLVSTRLEQGSGGSTNVTINGGGMYVGVDYRIGFHSGAGTTQNITVTGGSLEASQINFGYDPGGGGSTSASTCTMTITGGQVVTGDYLKVGANASISLDGGYLAIIGTGSDDLDFPEDSGNFGVLDIDGGTLVWNGTKEAEILQLFAEGRITVGGLAPGRGTLVIVEDEEADVTTCVAGITNADAAYNASPVGDVDSEGYDSILLEWTSGDTAVKHNVYFSTNFDDVNDRNPAAKVVTEGTAATPPTLNSYSPGVLQPGVDYYWAVDSLDSGNNVIASSPVWNFDLDDEIVLDDIEDGAGLWTAQNGSVFVEFDVLNRTKTDEISGLGGFDGDDNLKLLKWDFSVSAGAGQDDTVSMDLTKTATIGWTSTDWDITGIETLGIRYHGIEGEFSLDDTGDVKLFFQLHDGTSTSYKLYHEPTDPNLNQYKWDEDYEYFEVALADFTGVDLSSLEKLIIGVESRRNVADTNEVESGTLFIDNVALYVQRCNADAHPVLGDVDGGDCEVTAGDVEDVAAAWLAGPVTVNPTAPAATPLIYYPFDEDGGDATLVTDMSGNGNNATITDAAATPWVTTDCYDGGCIEFFNNDLEYVAAVDNPATVFANVTDQVTISMWIKGNADQPVADRVLTGRDASDTDTLKLHTPFMQGSITWQAGRESSGGFDFPEITLQFIGTDTSESLTDYLRYSSKDPAEFRSQWNHYAFVKDSTAGIQRIYLNGVLVAEDTSSDGVISDIVTFGIGGNAKVDLATWDKNYQGQVDEFRLYNTVLTQDEIANLAGVVGSFQQPTLEGEDISGPLGTPDGVVNFYDFGVVADLWLEGPVLFP